MLVARDQVRVLVLVPADLTSDLHAREEYRLLPLCRRLQVAAPLLFSFWEQARLELVP